MSTQEAVGDPGETEDGEDGDDDGAPSGREWLLVLAALLGAWLVAFTLVSVGVRAVVLDDLLIGVLTVAMAGYNLARVRHHRAPRTGFAVASAVLGLWLLAFSLQYEPASPLRWNGAAVGTLLAVVNTAYYRTNRPWE